MLEGKKFFCVIINIDGEVNMLKMFESHEWQKAIRYVYLLKNRKESRRNRKKEEKIYIIKYKVENVECFA